MTGAARLKYARRVSRLRLLVVLVAATLSAHAGADEPRARLHFETGKLLYRQGDYAAAAQQFRAGYEELPRPEFLLNAGVCYAKLHDAAAERETLERYLAVADAADPGRARAQALLDELAASPPPASANAPRPDGLPPIVTGAPPGTPAPAAEAPRPHGWRRWWWIAPLSAVVVAGVAVGIYFGVTHDACNPPLCIQYR